MSRIIACDPVKPDERVIRDIVAVLTDGAVVVMPTETQYALSVRADLETAPEKIMAVKRRSETIQAALFVKDIHMAERFCTINKTARDLAAHYLPGPMTLVLPAKEGQVAVASGFLSEHGFGIRISSSPVISAVMERAAFAVTATSANISGETTPATVNEISRALGNAVDVYVDAGPCRGVVPSTVVKVSDAVEIFRHGLIPEAEIRRFLQEGK